MLHGSAGVGGAWEVIQRKECLTCGLKAECELHRIEAGLRRPEGAKRVIMCEKTLDQKEQRKVIMWLGEGGEYGKG